MYNSKPFRVLAQTYSQALCSPSPVCTVHFRFHSCAHSPIQCSLSCVYAVLACVYVHWCLLSMVHWCLLSMVLLVLTTSYCHCWSHAISYYRRSLQLHVYNHILGGRHRPELYNSQEHVLLSSSSVYPSGHVQVATLEELTVQPCEQPSASVVH